MVVPYASLEITGHKEVVISKIALLSGKLQTNNLMMQNERSVAGVDDPKLLKLNFEGVIILSMFIN